MWCSGFQICVENYRPSIVIGIFGFGGSIYRHGCVGSGGWGGVVGVHKARAVSSIVSQTAGDLPMSNAIKTLYEITFLFLPGVCACVSRPYLHVLAARVSGREMDPTGNKRRLSPHWRLLTEHFRTPSGSFVPRPRARIVYQEPEDNSLYVNTWRIFFLCYLNLCLAYFHHYTILSVWFLFQYLLMMLLG